jgi:hypothetical protein
MDDPIFRALLGVGVGFGVLMAIVGITAYVLFSFGLMTLAKNKGIENAWLAWIPIGNLYILGKIVERVSIGSWEIPRLDIVLPIAGAVMWLGVIPVIGWLISIALLVLAGFVLHKLFSKYRPEQAVLYTVLSIALGLVWIFVFIIRNDQEIA